MTWQKAKSYAGKLTRVFPYCEWSVIKRASKDWLVRGKLNDETKDYDELDCAVNIPLRD